MGNDIYLDQLIRQEIEAFIKVHSVIQIIFDNVAGQEAVIPPEMLQNLSNADAVIEWMVGVSGMTQDEVTAIADDMNRRREMLPDLMDHRHFNA